MFQAWQNDVDSLFPWHGRPARVPARCVTGDRCCLTSPAQRVSFGDSGWRTLRGSLGFSSGALPAPRTAMNLFSTSNQNSAPSDAANAVKHRPRSFVRNADGLVAL